MLGAVLLGLVIPAVFASESNEGNIHLLEDEVEAALRTCTPDVVVARNSSGDQRQRHTRSRLTKYLRNNKKHSINLYDHERRNTSDIGEKLHVLNATEYDYDGYGSGNVGEKLTYEVPRMAKNRTKRHEPLLSKSDSDQCLSQCVFANLQVVDSRGIPRETELWSKFQTSLTSQQSRVIFRDQLRACFQELESEAEDDGCSYSNKLEECLMLQFSDRKPKKSQ